MMSFPATLKTSARALRANKGRSALTMLGIVIGIVSIVLVISLGQGAKELILGEVRGMGANFINITPGRQAESPTEAFTSLYSDSLKERDINALLKKSNVPGLESVAPEVIVSGPITYQDQTYRPVTLGWTMDDLMKMVNLPPEEGDYFGKDEIDQRSRVVVIGAEVKKNLFGENTNPIGTMVTIQKQKFRVMGTIPAYGQVLGFNIDKLVVMPYTTAQKDVMGIDYYQEVHARSAEGADVEQVAEDIRATLREMHDIKDSSKDDFTVLTQKDIAQRISTVTTVLSVFLVAIASIALVVGGVGIMNIMLVSVTERISEIGLRKAVGATNQDILRQFLFEAIMLTGIGGLVGTVLALSLSLLITIVVRTQFDLNWPYQLPISAFVIGVGVSTLIGVVFGIYPARSAAKKDPINALRHE